MHRKPMTTDGQHRKCGACGEIKPLEDFYDDVKRRGSYRMRCQGCFQAGNPLRKLTLNEKFWVNVEKRRADQCWPWRNSISVTGYGRFSYTDEQGIHRCIVASKMAYILIHGAVPDGLEVLHSCDNPCCCNPTHLRAGTHQENIGEAVERGRMRCGDEHRVARLKAKDIPLIKARRVEGLTFKQIGEEFGVSDATIQDVIKGKTWKHI